MKKTMIEVSVVVVGVIILGGLIIYKKQETKQDQVSMCPTDVMMCPDGSSVPREGPNCEFGICKQELVSYETPLTEVATTNPLSLIVEKNQTKPQEPKNFFPTINKQVSSVVETVRKTIAQTISPKKESGVLESQPNNQQTNSQPLSPQPTSQIKNSSVDETRYIAQNGIITDENNVVIYTTPPSNGGNSSWVTRVVDVVPVNDIAPIVGAIPVKDLPGKYYLSESSLNNSAGCLFSNKIYILDTKTNTKILMYEENNSTIPEGDPRACTSEIFLLATDNEKLVLKYHTIGTNTICETSWSEPEKTWYLDVTKPEAGTKRYVIAAQLYADAENQETSCRENYEAATSTLQEVNGG